MHRIPILLMFCSATCGVACSEKNDWKPNTRKADTDACKVAKESHCTAKIEKNQYEIALKKAQEDLKKAKKDFKKAKKAQKDLKNQQLSACWTMDRLDNWLTKFSTAGQCANEQGDVFYGIRVWTPTLEKCIQMLADSPMAVGLSWEPKSYAGLPYGGLSGGCRVLYENSMGHITQTDGNEAFQCYVRKSSLEDVPPVTTVDDVSLEKVEGKGYCLNSKGEANYAGTTTSKHIVTTESTCFQMFEDALPEAVGMYYVNSRCRVLYDHSSIGEITQSSGHEDYTCYKRSTPADNRRLQALPMV
jgi:hypothetical protein